MATADQLSPPTASGRNLRREVGLIGLLWASEGSIIGSGWLFGAKNALITAGPAALISWGIAAVIIIILALVHAELGGMFPISGGTARFPHYSFGGAAGASFGWFSWLQAASVAPVEVEAMIQYAQHWHWADSWMHVKGGTNVLTGPGIVIAVVLMAIFVSINFLGIRMLARVNTVATWWKVGAPLLAILVLSISNFHGGNFTAGGGFMPFGFKSVLLAIPGSGIVFSLLGFEQAIQLAGESSNPKRDIPRATILSILIGAAIYILVQVVYIAALPAATFVKGWANLSYANDAAPMAGLATLVGIGWLAFILYADAVISPGGTALIYSTSTSRVSYGLSRNGYFPEVFERTDRRGVPWFGMIMAFVAGCIFFLPFPSWQQLVNLITSASVLMYAGAPLAFGVFRNRLPEHSRAYTLRFGKAISPIAFILANLIIMWSGWTTVYKLGIAILIGYVLLAVTQLFKLNPIKPQLDFKAAQWLLPYLLGIGLITYLGSFGPMKSPTLAFGWDMGTVAVFSLVIYYWALAVALPTERIQSMIEEVVVIEEGGH
jgi:amino acid transporter